MRYRIVHRTAYQYATPVHESFNEVRLQPVSGPTQTCLDFDLAIDPPATVITYRDYYGNAVHDFGVPYLHDHLTVEATSDVITFAAAEEPLAGPHGAEPDTSRASAALARDAGIADEFAEYLGGSMYVALDAAAGELSHRLVAANGDAKGDSGTALAFARRVGMYIREHFTYQIGVTDVRSTASELIAGGSGVCQDFAHLFIALCRHAHLPARYVSGYLGNVTESEASHAWAEAYVPPWGWIGFDPTVGGPCTGRHVQVATGRDYADVAVVRGTYRGGAEATLSVSVRGETLGVGESVSGARAGDTGRGKMIQYQTLGAMRQFQRMGAMRGMTQTMGDMTQTLDPLTALPHQRGDDQDVPRQQPQQQQTDSLARRLR